MLVDLQFKPDADVYPSNIMAIIEIMAGGHEDKRIEAGIYLCNHFNFGHVIEAKTDYEILGYEYEMLRDGRVAKPCLGGGFPWDSIISSYGVADNVDQVKEYFKAFIESEDSKLVISMTKILRAEQPPQGGWRWHKWGEYIGNQNPQCEYIYDETNIDEVYCFHGYVLLEKG